MKFTFVFRGEKPIQKVLHPTSVQNDFIIRAILIKFAIQKKRFTNKADNN